MGFTYVDKHFSFFKHFPVGTDSELVNAKLVFTECGKLVDVFYLDITAHGKPTEKFVYCFTEAYKLKLPLLDYYHMITPSERYSAYFKSFDVLEPPIPHATSVDRDKLLLVVQDNYYFDQYGLSYLKQTKYYEKADTLNPNSCRTVQFASHYFCLYTNIIVDSDDYLLKEAMANGCIPVTHRDVPGIHYNVTRYYNYVTHNGNVYRVVEPNVQDLQEAIQYAIDMGKEEYEDMKIKVIEYGLDTRWREKRDAILQLAKSFFAL